MAVYMASMYEDILDSCEFMNYGLACGSGSSGGSSSGSNSNSSGGGSSGDSGVGGDDEGEDQGVGIVDLVARVMDLAGDPP